MIVVGVILVIVCWALPQIFPTAAPPLPALEHIGWVVGWIPIVVGIILWALGHFANVRYGNDRRHLY